MSTSRSWQVRRGDDFGMAIGEIRRSRGLTQREVAADIQVQRTYLAAIEGGRSSRVLEHMLRALRWMGATVTITWTIDDEVEADG